MVPDMGRNKDCQSYITFSSTGIVSSVVGGDDLYATGIWKIPETLRGEIKKYIINENATILFWADGTKTISKRDKKDKFDKELGFLFAYFYKKYKGSKSSMKRVLDAIDYKKIKTFLFEFYVNHSCKDYVQARNYLKNLKVAKK